VVFTLSSSISENLSPSLDEERGLAESKLIVKQKISIRKKLAIGASWASVVGVLQPVHHGSNGRSGSLDVRRGKDFAAKRTLEVIGFAIDALAAIRIKALNLHRGEGVI
jgi:hypothetical protein